MFPANPMARLKGIVAVAFMLVVFPLALRAATGEEGPTATDIIGKAETQARIEHKRILLDFSASWCGNCRLFEHFLANPEMNQILSRGFVFATMITGERADDTKHANTPGGVDFENALGGKDKSFPWLVMLDEDGKPIVNSERPNPKAKGGKNNIGYPDSPEEIDWFLEMLRRGAPQLSQSDLARVHAWLTAHSSTARHS